MDELVIDEGAAGLIGGRLRAARTAQGRSVTEVALAAGLTKGFLSRVERDRANLSVGALVRLCAVLNVPVGSVFAPEPLGHLLRRSDYRDAAVGGEGVREFLLTPRGERRVAAVVSELEPSAAVAAATSEVPAGARFVLVLRGVVELDFGDAGSVLLGAGDAFTFSLELPRAFRLAGDGMARVLWVGDPLLTKSDLLLNFSTA